MKIVIDIYEGVYDMIERDNTIFVPLIDTVTQAILNSTVLPKGHGRLIDADALLKHRDGGDWNGVCCDPEYVYARYIYSAPTIIEADKGEG